MARRRMLEGGLLWKYLGVVRSQEPRLTFLDDGLFRITQLLALNDPFEVKPRVLLDQFAEEDWTVARVLAQQAGFPTDDDEMVRGFFLEAYPAARMDERNFAGLYPAHTPEFRAEPFKTLAEIDEFRAHRVRATVEQSLNETTGVFSVTEDPLNLLMWAHYGAQHWGVAVGLDPQHAFFNRVGTLRRVDYRPQRVAVSFNGGLIRVAGHVLKDGAPPPVETLLRKSPDWAYEREWRLLVPLAKAHETHRDSPTGEAVHLLCFPESAIRSIMLGARLTDNQVADISTRIHNDQRWKQVSVFRARLSATEFALRVEAV
jgi:hypothetical protein